MRCDERSFFSRRRFCWHLVSFDSAAQPTALPIRRIDHIMIRADDPAKVYAFFTEVLRLPVAWPLMSPREGVATGGVGFGNVNVEAIRFPGQKGQPSRAQLLGFGFEPSPLAASLAELDRRGITYGAAAAVDRHRARTARRIRYGQTSPCDNFPTVSPRMRRCMSSSASTVQRMSTSSSVVSVCARSWQRAAAGHWAWRP